MRGQLLRLSFSGKDAYQPLLGQIARATGIDFTILSGRIGRIKRLPYGQLMVAVEGGNLDEALRLFTTSGVHVERLSA